MIRQGLAAFPGLDVSTAALVDAKLELLTDEGEFGLVKMLAQFPRVVEAASFAHEPHRIAFYLHDLASLFHAQWNRGKDAHDLRFVNENKRDLTCARLALIFCLSTVLATGLGVLGVSAPDEMR